VSDSHYLRYSPHHLWVLVVGESARLGVTERFGGPIDVVALPKVGECIRQGEPLGWVMNGETRRAVIAPISGTVVLINELLEGDTRTIVDDPLGAGWLIECQLSYDETLETLVDANEYQSLL